MAPDANRRIVLVLPADLRETLAYVLAVAGEMRRARGALVENFVTYLTRSQVGWEAYRMGPREQPLALVFCLLLPGATAVLLLPTPGILSIEQDAQLILTQHVVEHLAGRRLYYLQALLEPRERGKAEILRAAGFQYVTRLVYLERGPTYPWLDPPPPDAVTWLPYSDDARPTFAAALLESYRDSLDFPELSGLRPIDDVLRSHRAAGEFHAELWELAQINGRVAGCLLLAPLHASQTLEIAYVGVAPEFRRRGVGRLLMRRALEHCRRRRAAQLSVVVDQRNAPAMTLYRHTGFNPVAERDTFVHRWNQPLADARREPGIA